METEIRKTGKTKRIFVFLFLLLVISGGVFIYMRFFKKPVIPEKPEKISAINAGWMRHNWFSTIKTDKEIDEMAKMLKDMNLSILYIHTGPLDAKGNIPAPSKEAWLSNREKLLKKLPGLKFEAWLGGINEISYGKADDTLDMKNRVLIETIAKRAGEMTGGFKFDGVHYDIEPVPDNDEGFLLLLDLTRKEIGSKTLSISTPRILDSAVIRNLTSGIGGTQFYPWSIAYFRKAADRCDDIIIMAYDSGEPTEASYTKFMADQLNLALQTLNGSDCRLLMGIPSYEERTISHNAKSENVKSGIDGVVLGLNQVKDKDMISKNFKGIAIYAIWTTDQDEISIIRRKWADSGD